MEHTEHEQFFLDIRKLRSQAKHCFQNGDKKRDTENNNLPEQ